MYSLVKDINIYDSGTGIPIDQINSTEIFYDLCSSAFIHTMEGGHLEVAVFCYLSLCKRVDLMSLEISFV